MTRRKDETEWMESMQGDHIIKNPLTAELSNPENGFKPGNRRGMSAKRNRAKKGDLNNVNAQIVTRRASLEIPVIITSDHGASMKRGAVMMMNSDFPITDRWSGSLQTTTRQRGRTGYSTGSGKISYALGRQHRCGVGLSSDRHLQLGVSGTVGKGRWAAAVHRSQRWKIHTSACWDGSRYCSWNASCAFQRLGPRMQVVVASKTVHPWTVSLGWNSSLKQNRQPLLSFSVRPTLPSSPHRRLNLSASCRGWMQWSWNGSFTTTVSGGKASNRENDPSKGNDMKIGIGLSHSPTNLSTSKGLVWNFSWVYGDYTLRIPIELGMIQAAQAASIWTYPLQVLYLSLVSKFLHDVVADVFGLDSSQPSTTSRATKLAQQQQPKTKEEAQLQQEFMERHAKNRRKAEQEQSGLVICQAVYFSSSRNNDDASNETVRWNVHVPLQFWVTDSRLVLPATSKRSLLGFYPVVSSSALPPESSSEPQQQHWWRGFWTLRPTVRQAAQNHRPARLWVQYEYRDVTYEIVVDDDEELILPSSQATRVPTNE